MYKLYQIVGIYGIYIRPPGNGMATLDESFMIGWCPCPLEKWWEKPLSNKHPSRFLFTRSPWASSAVSRWTNLLYISQVMFLPVENSSPTKKNAQYSHQSLKPTKSRLVGLTSGFLLHSCFTGIFNLLQYHISMGILSFSPWLLADLMGQTGSFLRLRWGYNSLSAALLKDLAEEEPINTRPVVVWKMLLHGIIHHKNGERCNPFLPIGVEVGWKQHLAK